jgi:hypothetical protein
MREVVRRTRRSPPHSCDGYRMHSHPTRTFRPYYRYLFLVISSAVLFFYLYPHSSSTGLSSLFERPYEDPRLPRKIAIELHPRDHITRLPESVSHHWNITKGVRAPDGVNKTVYLINGRRPRPPESDVANLSLAGQFPGPTLEARSGDQLVITVSNQLEGGEGVAFHWHGLHMRGGSSSESGLPDMPLLTLEPRCKPHGWCGRNNSEANSCRQRLHIQIRDLQDAVRNILVSIVFIAVRLD